MRSCRPILAALTVLSVAFVAFAAALAPASSASAAPARPTVRAGSPVPLGALVGVIVTSLRHVGATVAERVMATDVYAMINTERAAHGLPPLAPSYALMRSAWDHDVWMDRSDLLSHRVPGEPDLAPRIQACGFAGWTYLAENASTGTADPVQELIAQRQMYRERPPENGHRLNILSRRVRSVGVAVHIDTATDRYWMTEDFGARVTGPPAPRTSMCP